MTRIYSLARELGLDGKDLVDHCARLGIPAGSVLRSLNEEEVARLRKHLNRNPSNKRKIYTPSPVRSKPNSPVPVEQTDDDLTRPGTAVVVSSDPNDFPSDAPPKIGGWVKDFKIVAGPIKGGQSTVWKAEKASIRKYYALKQPISHKHSERLLEREVPALVELRHTHLVQIHDVIRLDTSTKSCPYIVMDWVDGKTLDRHVKEEGMLSAQVAISVWLQIADAISHMHDKSFLHRDIKPSNVMLRLEGRKHLATVIDLGGAKRIELNSNSYWRDEETKFAGTANWSIPHIRDDKNGCGDQYALGLLLCWLLTKELTLYDGQPHPIERGLSELEAIIETTHTASPKKMYKSVHDMRSRVKSVYTSFMNEQHEERAKQAIVENLKKRALLLDDTVLPDVTPEPLVDFDPVNQRSPKNERPPTSPPEKIVSKVPNKTVQFPLLKLSLLLTCCLLFVLTLGPIAKKKLSQIGRVDTTPKNPIANPPQSNSIGWTPDDLKDPRVGEATAASRMESAADISTNPIDISASSNQLQQLNKGTVAPKIPSDADAEPLGLPPVGSRPAIPPRGTPSAEKLGRASGASPLTKGNSTEVPRNSTSVPSTLDRNQDESTSHRTLTKEVAEKYLANPDLFSLSKYPSIEASAAQRLADHTGFLHLDGLTTVSEEVAEALANHQGWILSLDGLNNLTLASAEALAKYRGSLSLNGLKAINPITAKSLANCEGGLYLDGIENITVETATALATCRNALSLDGIADLTPESAEALAKHRGSLSLDGIKDLSSSTAAALAPHTGFLFLDGIENLTPGSAEALAKHQGGLSLDGVKDLSASTAAALAPHVGFLYLDGIDNLTPDSAEALARHQGGLSLEGLTDLSPDTALELAKHNGSELSLRGLKTLGTGAAEALAKHQGNKLGLYGLTDLATDTAIELAKYHGSALSLNGLKTLTPGTAEALAKFQGEELWLGGLTDLSTPTAAALAEHKGGKLYLYRLTNLTVGVAEALAKHQGNRLSLSGLKSVSIDVARALAKYQGELDLGGLVSPEPEVYQILSRHLQHVRP